MGNLAYQKASRKLQKVSYKNLSNDEAKYIKAKQRFEQLDKRLSYFYSHCRRKDNGAVDFENMSEQELDLFEEMNKEREKTLKTMSKLEDKIDVDKALTIFLQSNTHSMSF